MQCQKHLFSLRESDHYLNCAYKAPLLKSAEEAAKIALVRNRNPIDISPDDFFETADDIRTLFANLINCNAREVALIPSTSYGLASVLTNIHSKTGQHALTVENEFPSEHFALEKWCRHNQTELRIIQPDPEQKQQGDSWNQRIINAINQETAVVVMSSIHWMNGLKFDLETIGEKCKQVGAKFIVDGTQSVGALPIDVKKCNIDVLICAAYKWLLGPYSTGLAYIGEPFHNGSPIEESWMNRTNAINFSSLTDYDEVYKPGAARYNVGETSNFILLPMLKASLSQILKWTVPAIQDYARQLSRPLLEYLQNIDGKLEKPEHRVYHLFGLKLPDGIDMDLLKQELIANKVYLSLRGESLRVSIHLFNTAGDVKKLIQTIEKIRA